ncbi:MAG: hypothetical protein RIR17_1500 [Planctomycetota bacterium]|jgi:rhodanese-related sulfurtransferase
MRKFIVTGLCLAITAISFAADYTKDSPEVIKIKIANGQAVLLDVREKNEWDESHISYAKWLPLSKISKGATKQDIEAVVGSGKPVYIHCKSGIRCMKAAEAFEKLGIKAEAINGSFADLKKTFDTK